MKCPYLISDSGRITIYLDGETHSVDTDHANYIKVLDAIKADDEESLKGLLNLSQVVQSWCEGRLTYDGGVVLYNGSPIHEAIMTRIIRMIKEGFDVTPLANFVDRVNKNPSFRSVTQLYTFLEKNSLPITVDGYLLAYKRVTDEYKDFHTNSVDNSPGAKMVPIPRNKVDDNPESLCSFGYHFCSLEYLAHFNANKGKIVVVKVDPADVVSIPTDFNNSKARCTYYEVIEEYKGEDPSKKYEQKAVYDLNGDDYDPEDEDDEDFEGDIDDAFGDDLEELGSDEDADGYLGYLNKDGTPSSNYSVRDAHGRFTKVSQPNPSTQSPPRDKTGKFIKKNP